ncbi:Uncharacterised protein [Mycobacterium tuberculosis]|uniref:Uncharacterized protein n=1 Tax=Mycobacterium tuberculosis TaxID=1773 RepID=A0A655ATA0_MYCTX|nr:Uncharacterised protein [Mycobacterium tuberculosis]COV74953.1 Uncharacterised protein [Mycobacterium tuberculosis]COY15781.1 Uncharacterised protein [Mycobacterium tuberculosis]
MIPTAIRTNVGNGDGVTTASIRPATRNTPTKPTATDTTPRPCSARTCPRGRLPADITDHPSRIPIAAARKTAVSSSSPCGRSRPSRKSPFPAWNISPAISPTLAALSKSTSGIGSPSTTDIAMHVVATQELFTQTCRANDAAGCSL